MARALATRRAVRLRYRVTLTLALALPLPLPLTGAQYVYGTECPSREQALKRYLQHNRNVYDAVPPGRLLVMDIAGGDGWDKLCRFIGRPVPTNITFPSRH